MINFHHSQAAHCCKDKTHIDATFNDWSFTDTTENGEYTLRTSEFFIHDAYWNATDGNSMNMDICLLRFSDNILSAGNGTAKVCLSSKYPMGKKQKLESAYDFARGRSLLDCRMGIKSIW